MVIGIDIGGTNTRFALVDEAGLLHGQGALRTADHPTFEGFVDALCEAIAPLVGRASGIGIGAPNALPAGIIDRAPNLPWSGVLPLVERLQGRFPGLKIALTNDAKAAALGEMTFGGARGMRDFALVTLGTGVGCGIVAGGSLLYGHSGMAGELGHTLVHPGGRLCGCGRRGCLETYAAAGGIVRTMRELDPSRPDLTARDVALLAETGDPHALRTWELTGEVLGGALANLSTLLDPEAIFLFGGPVGAGELLLGPLRRHFERLGQQPGSLLRTSELMDRNAAVLGAAALVAG